MNMQNKTTMKTTDKIHPLDPNNPTEKSDSFRAARGRTGKIARLPVTLREQLNERLLDGEGGKSLVAWLNSLPEVQSVIAMQFGGVPIREQNLSEWRRGGYQTWKKDKEGQQALTSFLEKIIGLKELARDGLTEPLALFLAARVAAEFTRLESLPDGEKKARAWRELTACVVALRRGDIEVDRLRLQRERYGLRHKTHQERAEEFWKWAEENINRDEFCRRRCFTTAEREAAINKILGITPAERGETVPEEADPRSEPVQSHLDPALIQPNPA
jgi:hypothetical protein